MAPSSLPAVVAGELLNPPPPRTPLDSVETRIWEEAGGIHGLSFVLRCLAQWWQIRAALGTESHPSDVMAAAVIERALRARTPGQFKLWSPDASLVHAAVADIDRLMGPPKARPW